MTVRAFVRAEGWAWHFHIVRRWTRRQCRDMSIALAILIVGASIVMTVPMGTTQLVVGGLTALGSTFSGFLARTFLDARNRSIDQLNRSHLVPQAKTLLFVAERLSDQVGDDQARIALLGEVVKSALRSVDTILAGEADNGRARLDRAKRRAPRASDRAAGGDPK